MNTEKSKKQQKTTAKNKSKGTKQNITGSMYSKTDPNGSYTGVPREKGETPVQDADDL